MKVRLRNIEVDSNIEPIKLIFDNDDQRIQVADHLLNMEPKEGIRGYIQFPDNMSKEEMESYLTINSEDSSYKDKYIRASADFDNFKRRVSKEKEEIKNSVKISMLSSILDIDSDLSLALNQIKDKEAKEGVNLILNKLDKFLKSQNIESIQTDIYDSDNHEVISILETGENKIVDVVSKGYMMAGKPLRFPKIILSK